ncbi:hypothetical protein OsJ_20648 [Oryza sativa Japonica Group]|uniref:UBL3-like ubiquitin domain-containing protein n=1 Tax=Oryza sativa subsp. japonica TaxID=39947 RepID=B9FSA1_ORYSJ|nr:hypothetical protein OsJ_20648 [Oryza sativa Japonica Group]
MASGGGGGGGMEAVEVRFRLDDGSDIGPSMHDQATTVTALKEFVLARWPQGKEIAPRTVNDVTIINAGQVLENNRTLAESRNLAAESPEDLNAFVDHHKLLGQTLEQKCSQS